MQNSVFLSHVQIGRRDSVVLLRSSYISLPYVAESRVLLLIELGPGDQILISTSTAGKGRRCQRSACSVPATQDSTAGRTCSDGGGEGVGIC